METEQQGNSQARPVWNQSQVRGEVRREKGRVSGTDGGPRRLKGRHSENTLRGVLRLLISEVAVSAIINNAVQG